MKKKTKLIILGTALVIAGLVIGKSIEVKKRAGEYGKYENWCSAKVQTIMNRCDIKLEDVDKIRIEIDNSQAKDIGCEVDGKKASSVYYIIEDEEIIEDILEKIDDIRVYGAKQSVRDLNSTEECRLVICSNKEEYALYLDLNSINGENYVETANISVLHKDFPNPNDKYPNPSISTLSEWGLIYDVSLVEYIEDICREKIEYISVENIIDIYDDGDLTKFWAYENGGRRAKEDVNVLTAEKHTHMYTFPIKDFDGYALLERQNEAVSGGEGEGSTLYTDVLDAKIYNNSGEYVDFMKASRDEVEAFLTEGKN